MPRRQTRAAVCAYSARAKTRNEISMLAKQTRRRAYRGMSVRLSLPSQGARSRPWEVRASEGRRGQTHRPSVENYQ